MYYQWMIIAVAVLMYLLGAFTQSRRIIFQKNNYRLASSAIVAGLVAFALHCIVVWFQLLAGENTQSSLLPVLSAFMAGAFATGLLFSLLFRGSEYLLPIISLFAAVALFASGFNHAEAARHGSDIMLILHIVLSLLAFGLILLSCLQVLGMLWLDRLLKRHHILGPARLMPPMQIQERILLTSLKVGSIFLLLALASGLLFIDEIFPENLFLQLILICSLLGLIALMGVRYRKPGWSVVSMVMWILGGSLLLLLAYICHRLATVWY